MAVLETAKEYADRWGVETLAILRCAKDIVLALVEDDTGLEAEAIRYTASRLEHMIKVVSLVAGKGEE